MTKDERTQKEINTELLNERIRNIQLDVKEIKEILKTDYVTKDEYDPIKKLVYGLVGLILIGVVGALLSLVILQ